MKRISLAFLITLFLLSHAVAQTPSWAKKAATAVFTLKTFGADGQLLGSANGFFIGADGEAVSSFTPFKGAVRAVIIDAQGKEWPVTEIKGADDTYDVAKFQVDIKKTATLPIATANAASGSTTWLLPYSVKKVPTCPQGKITDAEPFQDSYAYYTLDMPAQEQHIGCPLLNESGEAIGLLQPSHDAKSGKSYAVSARYAGSLRIGALSINDPVLRSTRIAKALPEKQDEALLALYTSATALDSVQYVDYIDRFIQKYPNVTDGYVYRARNLAAAGRYADADADMQQAVKVADRKDDAYYQYAQLIYQKELYRPGDTFAAWSLDKALGESLEAYRQNPMPIYRQQQAQILYAQKKYDEAYGIYDELTHSPLRSPDIFYAAAQCKLQAGDRDAHIALLDSAVNQFSKPYVRTAAPYLLARAQALYEAGKYRPAVNDYNTYGELMSAQLTADFYYLREQAEFAGHLYQQALDDIRQAVTMAPAEPAYLAEQARVELRVGMNDEAALTAARCVNLAPQESDGYLLLGLAQCLKGQKQEGVQNLQKAKELGNSQAQALIEKYSK